MRCGTPISQPCSQSYLPAEDEFLPAGAHHQNGGRARYHTKPDARFLLIPYQACAKRWHRAEEPSLAGSMWTGSPKEPAPPPMFPLNPV